jgi:hypothetical protein
MAMVGGMWARVTKGGARRAPDQGGAGTHS